MRPDVDVLFVNPGNRFQIYQDLGDEFCALEPPALAGLYATYVRRHGYGVAILDAPVGNLDSMDAAREAVTTYRPRLVVTASRADRKSTRLNSSHVALSPI